MTHNISAGNISTPDEDGSVHQPQRSLQPPEPPSLPLRRRRVRPATTQTSEMRRGVSAPATAARCSSGNEAPPVATSDRNAVPRDPATTGRCPPPPSPHAGHLSPAPPPPPRSARAPRHQLCPRQVVCRLLHRERPRLGAVVPALVPGNAPVAVAPPRHNAVPVNQRQVCAAAAQSSLLPRAPQRARGCRPTPLPFGKVVARRRSCWNPAVRHAAWRPGGGGCCARRGQATPSLAALGSSRRA